jgi:hypothetical protein
VSELDFNQKLEMRRAFWAMGASTRIDVKLSALVQADSKNRTGSEEWTDLDVLAVEYVPMAGIVTAVADCKTGKSRATERVFWLRGVSDLFGARAAYLSRDAELPSAARQLALRLGISAMTSEDRRAFLEQAGSARLPKVGGFIEGGAVRSWEKQIAMSPKATEKLQRYRRSFYWVFPRHRNLSQLPGYLIEAAKQFDPKQLWAQTLLFDLAWMYLLTVLHAVDEITRLHLSGFDASLKQVFVGSEQEIRDKEATLKVLLEFVEVKGARAPFSVVPPYFSDLVDLTTRAARRRSHATEALRVLEFTGVETIAARGEAWTQAFPSSDPLDAKLASDVVRFLARAANLSSDFVDIFDDAVAGAKKRSTVSVSVEKSPAVKRDPDAAAKQVDWVSDGQKSAKETTPPVASGSESGS